MFCSNIHICLVDFVFFVPWRFLCLIVSWSAVSGLVLPLCSEVLWVLVCDCLVNAIRGSIVCVFCGFLLCEYVSGVCDDTHKSCFGDCSGGDIPQSCWSHLKVLTCGGIFMDFQIEDILFVGL